MTAVPFHIRRPNKQLVREFEQLMNWQGTNILKKLLYFPPKKNQILYFENFNFTEAERFVEMTIPLTFGHLIRVTCMRAGHRESMEQKE